MPLSITAKSLSKSYGSIAAVDGIDLSVKQGHIFGFLGPNGAGKSTTIKMLTTLIAPSSGSLHVLGIDAQADPMGIRRRIGVVLQQPSYEPSLSVERSLDVYGMMWDVPKKVRQKRVPELLAEFGLQDLKRRNMDDLSIGQQRRVQVAREFMHDMDLLFLDEPTVGLDPHARRDLLEYLKAKARAGLTILYTTHVLFEAEYICDEIAIINRGKIVALSTPAELKKKFGKQKTMVIHLSYPETRLPRLLLDVAGCRVDLNSGTDVTISSGDPEETLLQILDILHTHDISLEELSVESTSLEDIFLKVIGEADAPAC